MGVCYSRYLVPDPATYVPTCKSIAQLIDALISNGWLASTDSPSCKSVRHKIPDNNARVFDKPGSSPYIVQLPKFVAAPGSIDPTFLQSQLDNGGLLLQYSLWRLDQDNIKYPLARFDHERQYAYFDVEFWLSPDFVYLTSETLEGYENSYCQCGHELAHEKISDIFSPNKHFPLQCPVCGAPFNPAEHVFRAHNGYTGERADVAGGTVFRFAIEIDCNKCIPKSSVEFSPEFRDLCANLLRCNFTEIENIH